MRPGRRQNKGDLGFTLAEMLVVLIVLAIAAAMIIPSFSSNEEVKAASGASAIAADLEYAQNVAVTYEKSITVTFDPAGESYTLSDTNGPLTHPVTISAYTVDFTAQSAFRGLNIVSANFGGTAKVVFNELGSPDNSGSVTIKAGLYTYRIDVATATGKVAVVNVAG